MIVSRVKSIVKSGLPKLTGVKSKVNYLTITSPKNSSFGKLKKLKTLREQIKGLRGQIKSQGLFIPSGLYKTLRG